MISRLSARIAGPSGDALLGTRAGNYPIWGHVLPGLGSFAPAELSTWASRLLDAAGPESLFIMLGNGQEAKREFQFIKVEKGEGTYIYLGDLNADGKDQINECDCFWCHGHRRKTDRRTAARHRGRVHCGAIG